MTLPPFSKIHICFLSFLPPIGAAYVSRTPEMIYFSILESSIEEGIEGKKTKIRATSDFIAQDYSKRVDGIAEQERGVSKEEISTSEGILQSF